MAPRGGRAKTGVRANADPPYKGTTTARAASIACKRKSERIQSSPAPSIGASFAMNSDSENEEMQALSTPPRKRSMIAKREQEKEDQTDGGKKKEAESAAAAAAAAAAACTRSPGAAVVRRRSDRAEEPQFICLLRSKEDYEAMQRSKKAKDTEEEEETPPEADDVGSLKEQLEQCKKREASLVKKLAEAKEETNTVQKTLDKSNALYKTLSTAARKFEERAELAEKNLKDYETAAALAGNDLFAARGKHDDEEKMGLFMQVNALSNREWDLKDQLEEARKQTEIQARRLVELEKEKELLEKDDEVVSQVCTERVELSEEVAALKKRLNEDLINFEQEVTKLRNHIERQRAKEVEDEKTMEKMDELLKASETTRMDLEKEVEAASAKVKAAEAEMRKMEESYDVAIEFMRKDEQEKTRKTLDGWRKGEGERAKIAKERAEKEMMEAHKEREEQLVKREAELEKREKELMRQPKKEPGVGEEIAAMQQELAAANKKSREVFAMIKQRDETIKQMKAASDAEKTRHEIAEKTLHETVRSMQESFGRAYNERQSQSALQTPHTPSSSTYYSQQQYHPYHYQQHYHQQPGYGWPGGPSSGAAGSGRDRAGSSSSHSSSHYSSSHNRTTRRY